MRQASTAIARLHVGCAYSADLVHGPNTKTKTVNENVSTVAGISKGVGEKREGVDFLPKGVEENREGVDLFSKGVEEKREGVDFTSKVVGGKSVPSRFSATGVETGYTGMEAPPAVAKTWTAECRQRKNLQPISGNTKLVQGRISLTM